MRKINKQGKVPSMNNATPATELLRIRGAYALVFNHKTGRAEVVSAMRFA